MSENKTITEAERKEQAISDEAYRFAGNPQLYDEIRKWEKRYAFSHKKVYGRGPDPRRSFDVAFTIVALDMTLEAYEPEESTETPT